MARSAKRSRGYAVGVLPLNTVKPAITGTAQSGQTLTTTNGSWTNSPIGYSRQWLRGGIAIAGATGTTLALSSTDIGIQIAVRVTATNASGGATVISSPSAPVAA